MERTYTTRRMSTGRTHGPEIALGIGAVLLASAWLVPALIGLHAVRDPEGAYRDGPYESSDPWGGFDAADRDTARGVVVGLGAGAILLAVLGAVAAGWMVWSGRPVAALVAVGLTVLMIAAALALSVRGHWDGAWNVGLAIAAVVGGAGATLLAIFAFEERAPKPL